MNQTHPLTTTTFELPGYRAMKSFGVVRGIVVRSRSIIGNIGASIQSIFGYVPIVLTGLAIVLFFVSIKDLIKDIVKAPERAMPKAGMRVSAKERTRSPGATSRMNS